REPGSVSYRDELSGCYADLAVAQELNGDADAAKAAEVERAKLWVGTDPALERLAKARELASWLPQVSPDLTPTLPDRAIKALHEAVELGFDDAGPLGDEAFTGLQERDDFREILERLGRQPKQRPAREGPGHRTGRTDHSG